MEKIKLRKINFSKKMLENLGMLGTLLESAGINKDGLPEEMDVYVDPEKVVATSEVITMENKDYPPAFKIYFSAREDDSTKLYVENYDELQPRKMRYGGNWKNYDAECPEHFKAKMRPATIQEVLEYFNGIGEWNYYETFGEEKYKFIDTI